MDYTYSLVSIHIYLLILNSNYAANIHLLFQASKYFAIKLLAQCPYFQIKAVYLQRETPKGKEYDDRNE